MQQDRSRRATTSSLFILVSPAAVVSECFAAKEIWLGRSRRRIVNQYHEDLAVVISVALVIVPTLLRRIDAVTDENEIGVDVDVLRLRASERDEVAGKLESLTSAGA